MTFFVRLLGVFLVSAGLLAGTLVQNNPPHRSADADLAVAILGH